MRYRIIVAHPGQQHSFHTASAFKKNNMLLYYVTTVYNNESSKTMHFIKRFLTGDNLARAVNRRNRDLTESEVIQFGEWRGLLEIFLARYDKGKKIYNWWQKHTANYVGKCVARLAIKEQADAVIMYDTNAKMCFEMLQRKAPEILKIMDTSAANRIYMKEIYENDMKLCPQFARKLKAERRFLWNNGFCNRLKKELEVTDVFLAPSNFVKKSLEYSGIQADRIEICPYGSNFDPIDRSYDISSDRPIEAIYVGNVTEMKGVSYLLEAAFSIPTDKVRLTVVGAYDNSEGVFNKYLDHINFTGRVLHDQVKKLLCRSDIFVFPSLGEGLSLSVLEAMACGLPCIVSENSGANDAIIDGVNGYEVEIQNSDVLREKMLWFAEHRNSIPEMGRAAAESVQKYSWGGYEKRIVRILKERLDAKVQGTVQIKSAR